MLMRRSKSRKVLTEHDHGVFEGKVSLVSFGGLDQFLLSEALKTSARYKTGRWKFHLNFVKRPSCLICFSLIIQAINGGQHVTDANVEYLKPAN